MKSFPPEFVWGAATSAAQIEGAADEDGKSPSIWDHCAAHMPGRIASGDSPAVACNHYHRWKEDIELMRAIGIRHYRFSVAWPRIVPDADGAVNRRGLDFYSRLVDGLLEAGITPWVTLFHWDLPQWLEEQGGWPVRSTAEAFPNYARAVVRVLGDRVVRWMTMNELPCFIGDGYGRGSKAPYCVEPEAVVNQAYHHALLAHGYGVQAVREFADSGAAVGIVHNPAGALPLIETDADIAAAKAVFARETARFLGPVFHGSYPETPAAPRRIAPGDMELIGQPTDFLGLNLYFGNFVRADGNGDPEVLTMPADFPRGGFDWLPLTPSTLYWAPRFAHEIYAPKTLYITENGVNCGDVADEAGNIDDVGRVAFYQSYLAWAQRAASEIPLAGYFAWSLMDNFEWSDGYDPRMGFVHVDYQTQKRTPKLSAAWYATVMRENRVV